MLTKAKRARNAEVVREWNAGATQTALAATYQVSPQTINHVLREASYRGRYVRPDPHGKRGPGWEPSARLASRY